MKRLYFLLTFVLSLTMVLTACGRAPSAPTSANLFVVVGNYASHFAGNGNGDGLLLDQFRKENKVSMYVQIANDREMKDFKDQMVNNVEGAPDIMIADDSLLVDNLQNVKLIASHHVGIAIRQDVADGLGLQGNVIPFADYVQYSKSGQLLVTGSNALAGFDSAEFFFSTMAWCSNTDAANLTAEIIQQEYVRQCGKDVYDHIKSTNGSNEAAQLVMNAGSNGYNSLIAFDSVLMGNSGINSSGDKLFKFFYFKEATAKAKLAIGTKDFGKDQAKKDTANALSEFFLSDSSQKEINLAGFTEGSSALVEHYDAAFKSEWGVSSNPIGVQIVNPPISNIATNALLIYRDMYKRLKIVYFIYDTSGSTETADILSNDKDGNSEEIVRLQAISRSIEKFTESQWQIDNGVVPGPNDVFKHYYFSSVVSELISESVGPNTYSAGKEVIKPIGPAYGPYDFNQNKADIGNEIFSYDGVTPYWFGGTAIFDAADFALKDILKNYNPNADYYIVVLTDGEWMDGMPGVVLDIFNNPMPNEDSFYKNWLEAEKENITFVGIQFGSDGNSLDAETVTNLMNGDTYDGANDKELTEAFKFILGN